jgi:hypothetical protein
LSTDYTSSCNGANEREDQERPQAELKRAAFAIGFHRRIIPDCGQPEQGILSRSAPLARLIAGSQSTWQKSGALAIGQSPRHRQSC